MSSVQTEVRTGAYYDSVVLMHLQRALAERPGIVDVGVVMGTPANKELLEQSDLLTDAARAASVDDLIIVVKGDSTETANTALSEVDDLLAKRRSQTTGAYRPRSLDSAARMLPDARWVLVSVPGRYAVGVAQEALDLQKNVFLYSDNISLEDEVALKRRAAGEGLLVMGPDCGTAIVNGVGLGFANRVRRGSIGVVAASGTGLQAVTAGIHRLGAGITHALGTGGRDLSEKVEAITARQGLDLLGRDPTTEVIVLISKPPAPAVASALIEQARSSPKPVVVNFIGFEDTDSRSREGEDGLYFAGTLDHTVDLAVALATGDELPTRGHSHGGDHTAAAAQSKELHFSPSQRYLRGLFSGGTLAYEALLLLRGVLPAVYSNVSLDGVHSLENPHESRKHTIVDLGEDEFTVGRLHPMMDNELRIRRLQEEVADPKTAAILLDVVLGDGAHPDPAAELAPAISTAMRTAKEDGRELAVLVVVIGTDEDPQGFDGQVQRLQDAGATVFSRNSEAVRAAVSAVSDRRLATGDWDHTDEPTARKEPPELKRNPSARAQKAPDPIQDPNRQSPIANQPDLTILTSPLAALNVGLESFATSLDEQGASVVQLDWSPPAGGNERLMGILAKMKRGKHL